ncbi:hypothetical protein GCM10010251_34140 [Streptomyces aurantiogriseus]|uniref:Uncharacterized protein n=1 Tax=Streptomyces aurantiogriseus TaxID=66870 RepID=A0A918F9X9_9ACTN|nr:hypothetical protein GCM10010251_34140 [Streptomyces aurantiogriseus]
MTGGQFGDDPGGGGADVVDVEFGLGQAGDEGVQVVVGQRGLPGTAPLAWARGPGRVGAGDRLIGASGSS